MFLIRHTVMVEYVADDGFAINPTPAPAPAPTPASSDPRNDPRIVKVLTEAGMMIP